MPKSFQKYFIAIVPEGRVQEKATDIKLQLKEKFDLKYALKSPAHITLKMPFVWNEAKQDKLALQLALFFRGYSAFELLLQGIGSFGKRVLYIRVREDEKLQEMQKNLTQLCKTQLNLKSELSDYAYHPHMTLAFKDIKEPAFKEYLGYLRNQRFKDHVDVRDVALLKKENGRWKVCQRFDLEEA